MDVYVLNRDLEILDVCDDYESIIWTTKYFNIGDFELYLPATPKNVALLKKDRYVVRDKDVYEDGFKNVMIIEKIKIATSMEDGNFLTVTGRCLKSILTRRIIWQQTVLRGQVEAAIRTVVNDNAVNPLISARKINDLQLGQFKGYVDPISRQVTGDNLATFIIEVCTSYGLGWDIYIEKGKFIFELYNGVDRSYNQDEIPYVAFSNEFDNLLSTDYEYDKTNYKNVTLVAGEGEGADRKTTIVGTASDLDRYELYVDSRNSSTNNGEITEEEYYLMLAEEGIEKLTEDANAIKENVEGQIEPLGNYVYGVDYFLGDIVEVITEHGIETTPRIIEIIESEDNNGSSTIPTFSTWEV